MLDKVSDKNLTTDFEPESEVLEPLPEQETAADTAGKKRPLVVSLLLGIVQIILVIAVLAGSYSVAQRMIAERPEPRKRPAFNTVYTITTVKPEMKDHQPVFTSYGQTVAARSVELRALVSGEIRAINTNLRGGARVNKGDTLIEIDQFNYRGALAEAKANLDEAKARIGENEAQIELEKGRLKSAQEQLTFAEADLTRAEQLRQRGSATQQVLEARKLVVSQRKQAVALSTDTIKVQEARLNQLKASIDRLNWRVEQAERNLASTKLVAPFSGIVRSSSAEIGRNVTANDVVVSLYETGSLEVRFTLTDAQYGRLQTSETGLIGRTAKVAWTVGGQDYVYDAKIDRVSAEIASNRGGVEVIAKIASVSGGVNLRPGAFVELQVPDRVFKNTFVVPDTALYGADRVYTVVDGKLVENAVKVVAFEGETALISEGLSPGDEVLTTRITEVSAGLSVRREGDPVERRGPPKSGESGKPVAGAASGRPSREEMAAILKANNLDRAAFRALSREEKRALISKHRAQSQAAAKQ